MNSYDIKVHFDNYSFVHVECDDSIFYELRDYFSFQQDGYMYHPKFRSGVWDGKIYLLTYERKLPFGLANLVAKFASNMDYKVWIDPRVNEKNEVTREEFDEWLNSLEIYSGNTRIQPHWYQADAVYEVVKNSRNIINLPTSAGKSLCLALMSRWYLEHYEGKVLIIVPRTQLVNQLADDFVDYRLFPRAAMHCMKSGSRKNPEDALITISTWQSAIKMQPEWFKQYGFIQNDECHESVGKSISTIIQLATHMKYKVGLSGTLRDGKANLMQYIGMFGDVYKPVSTRNLIDDGQVSQMKINTIFLRYSDAEAEACKKLDYTNEIKFITGHKKRNQFVVKLAKKLAGDDKNVLVMFRLVKHGKLLYEALKAIHGEDKVHFVNGETDAEVRNQLKYLAEGSTGNIIVASYGTTSTGVSIKNLHYVILAASLKSKTTLLQTLGRVLRKHESKECAYVFDLIDDLGVKPKSANSKKKYTRLNFCLRHGVERIQRYNDEQFDYSIKNIAL